jgi:hypothetical protein
MYGTWRKSAANAYLFGNKAASRFLCLNKNILILRFKMNWSENIRTCLDLGMMPLRIDTLQVKSTLLAFANGTNWDKHKIVG